MIGHVLLWHGYDRRPCRTFWYASRSAWREEKLPGKSTILFCCRSAVDDDDDEAGVRAGKRRDNALMLLISAGARSIT
jgi:hypothetical protein